jgi:hypothetical protein
MMVFCGGWCACRAATPRQRRAAARGSARGAAARRAGAHAFLAAQRSQEPRLLVFRSSPGGVGSRSFARRAGRT